MVRGQRRAGRPKSDAELDRASSVLLYRKRKLLAIVRYQLEARSVEVFPHETTRSMTRCGAMFSSSEATRQRNRRGGGTIALRFAACTLLRCRRVLRGMAVGSVVGVGDEESLVRRARAGDEAAFSELITTHRRAVWAVCVRITGNTHDAEDALQEALVAAWRGIGRFRADSRISTWLFRIASNASLAVVRRRQEVADADVESASTGPDLGDRVADAERVQSALTKLPEAFRLALVLRVYGDLSYEEIAVHQGIPVQTVKTRLFRARSMMQHLLAPMPD